MGRYLLESGEIEIAAELKVDVDAVVGVLGVVEIVRSQEGVVHEGGGDSIVTH